MNKCHTPITWVNDQTPAINDTHLNQYDGELDTLDDRIITLDGTKALQSDLLLAFKDVSLDATTGIITFTLFNNTTKTIDTLLEKIAINFDYDDDPTSPHYQNLIIELEDGTYKYIDMSALITEYEFDTSSTIAFTVANDGTVTADVIDGSITSTKLDPAFAVTIADAESNGLKSEGYAVGTQNGVPVTSGSPYYQNNAKYWRDQAHAIVSNSFAGLDDVDFNNLQDGQVAVYNSTSQMWENEDLPDPTVLLPHVVITSDTGATVTLTKGGTTITATETSTGTYEADVDDYGTWTIDSVLGGDDAQVTLVVDTVKIYTIDDTHFSSSIIVSYNSSGTCALSATGQTTQYATSSPYTFTVRAAATYTVTVSYGGTTITRTVTISATGQTETVNLVWGKTFAASTDAEIANMVALADAGEIDLETDCGWTVGQEHSVSLNAIAASGTYDGVSWSVGESQSAQTVTFVLMHKGLYELVNPVLDTDKQTRNTCSFIVGMKDCLETRDYINSTDTNTGSWNGCARRNWCNGGFRGAIPADLRPAFKQFKTITAETYYGSTNQTSNDYFALAALKEVLGGSATDYCNAYEASALTQFTYYTTSSNIPKKIEGSNAVYWNRGPAKSDATRFCRTGNGSGWTNPDALGASYALGLSPFGCL